MSPLLDTPPEEAQAPITVLHVDDDPGVVETTAAFLERQNERLTVRTATDPRRALDDGIDGVDCVVSDYEMPDMDGIEFLEALRADDPSLPVILFTGRGSEAVASEAISAGVTDYLQKGTGTEQYELLCQRIENAVGRRRARTNYRELFEKTPVGLTIHDPETGIIVDTNRAFGDLLGYDPEQLVGTHPGELSPGGSPFTRERADRLIREATEEGSRTFEWQDRTNDGDDVWVEVTLRPTSIEGRQRVLAVVQDVTHRRERERTLERERDRFEAIFEHSNDAILVLDPANDSIVDADTRAEELLEYAREDLLTSVAISDVHPDHIERFRAFLERVRRDGTGWTDEFCCVTKSGAEREVEISAAAVEHDDDQYLVANVRDITERVKRETELEQVRERMEFVLEATDAVIWERDPETGSFTTHPDPCPVLDGSIETVADFRERIHSDDVPAVEDAMSAATGTGDPRRVEFRTVEDVTAEWVETRIQPVTDDDGSVERLTGIARDVTDRKRRERDLERQNERLDEFVSVVSHDLRNPLNVAQGRLALARDDHAEPGDHLDDVERALERMNTLVEDLLALARDGDRAIDVEPIDLAEIVGVCWRTVETGDATFSVDTDRTIRADRNRFQQLVENLMRNAVEHGSTSPGSGACQDAVEHGSTSSRTGSDDTGRASSSEPSVADAPEDAVEHAGETVTVRVGELDDGTGFYVEDDGTGIPTDERDRVFEAGYTTSEDGTGFGLRIVEQIADSHGWDVTVTDGESGGARFEFTGVDFETE